MIDQLQYELALTKLRSFCKVRGGSKAFAYKYGCSQSFVSQMYTEKVKIPKKLINMLIEGNNFNGKCKMG